LEDVFRLQDKEAEKNVTGFFIISEDFLENILLPPTSVGGKRIMRADLFVMQIR
jgi:hypothetical protein